MPLPTSDPIPGPGYGMPVNPVESIQKNHLVQTEKERLRKASAVYGQHAPLRMLMERNALAQFRRLPGLRSNLVGLSELLDLDDTIEPEDMYNQFDECPVVRQGELDLHSIMEKRLGMNADVMEVTNMNLTETGFNDFANSLKL